MLSASIYPHRLCFAGTLETKSPVELDSVSVSSKHLLVIFSIYRLHSLHHFSSDTTAVLRWMNKHMWVINHQMAIRDRIANTYQCFADTRSNLRMRVSQSGQQLLRHLCRRPLVSAIQCYDFSFFNLAINLYSNIHIYIHSEVA